MLHIAIDKALEPFTQDFWRYGHVDYLQTESLTAETLNQYQAAILRTTTPVKPGFIKSNTQLSFLASVSAGNSHVDTNELLQHHVSFAYAPGCNAIAVMNYVVSALCALDVASDQTIGIIGFGHVGALVFQTLTELGFSTRRYDPPLGLTDTLFDADVICVHPALTFNPPHPSFHLLDAAFQKKLKPNTLVINAARGNIMDENGMRKDLRYVLDVFADEPNPNKNTIEQALLVTPHIAGYSLNAKYRGAQQILSAFCQHVQLPYKENTEHLMPIKKIPCTTDWRQQVLETYDLRNDHFPPNGFLQARKNYQMRSEFLFC